MATPAQATIVHILGDAYLRDATGKLTALKPGDHVNENQVVVTGPDGSMVLQLPNGEQVAIGEDRSLLVDAAFLGTAPAEPQDAVLSQVDQDTAQVAQVLAQGGDISELLDPAAAGLTAAGENSGHSFIRLMRVVESVDPLAFNFGQTGSETPPDIDLGLAAADQALANAAPVGADAHHVIEEDTSVTGRIVASDPNGDPLSFTMADNGMPTHGTVVLGPDGTYVYTPNQDYNGSDRFVVEVSDGRGGTTTVVITIDITPVNDPPVGEDQAIVTNEDVPVSGQLVAHDVDGDPLTFTKASDPQHGTVVINPDGSYTYTPAQDYNGKDSFTVTVDDGQGGQDTIVVTIDVMPMPDPAIITPATPGADQGLVKEDTIFTTSGKLDIVDPDAGEAVFNAGTIQDGPYGSLTIDAAGNWTYTLNNADPAVQVLKEGESIVRPITVTSADGTTHVITVTIQGTNETATLGSGTVQEDTTLTADGTLVATGVATFVPSTQA
ncbi:retention module-containing protein, partial [Chitiniphilus shinanonensis]